MPDYQFGFRQNHNTIEQIHRMINSIIRAMEEKKYCTAAFLDVEKAFNKVWHEGLLQKFQGIVPKDLYPILESYITNRYFYVRIKNEKSSLKKIHAGVPQGSVLGLILYALFIADQQHQEQKYTLLPRTQQYYLRKKA